MLVCWFSLEIHNFSSPFFSFLLLIQWFLLSVLFFNPKIRLILRLTQTVFVKFQGNKSLQKTIRIDFVMYFPLLTLTMHSRKKIFSCYMQKFIETLAPIIYTNPRWFWLSYPFRLLSVLWKNLLIPRRKRSKSFKYYQGIRGNISFFSLWHASHGLPARA